MIELKTLPKNPQDALKVLLQKLISITPDNGATFGQHKVSHKTLTEEIYLTAKAAIIASSRILDDKTKEIASVNLEVLDKSSMKELRKQFEVAFDALLVLEFGQHFLEDEDIADFDHVTLTTNEKSEIREILAKARKLTDEATFLSDDHKRRLIHRISDVENELYKETAGFKSFLAAAADVSGLVRKFGDDAKPLAEAIETARTITEKKVEGYQRIEEQEKPKQITDQTD